jgi:hypothetical protein
MERDLRAELAPAIERDPQLLLAVGQDRYHLRVPLQRFRHAAHVILSRATAVNFASDTGALGAAIQFVPALDEPVGTFAWIGKSKDFRTFAGAGEGNPILVIFLFYLIFLISEP